MRLHFIDVGQGDATLVEFPCAAILIDAGGEIWRSRDEIQPPKYDGRQALVDYLTDFFEDSNRAHLGGQLDALYLTHPHKDHTSAVKWVLEEFRPKNIIHNGQRGGSGSEGQYDARHYARQDSEVGGWYVLERNTRGAEGQTNEIIDPVMCNSVDPEINMLWGQVRSDSGWYYEDFENENNHSLVIKIVFGEATVLFTGDLETAERSGYDAGIERLIKKFGANGVLDADVYQVGHHGSDNGTTQELVSAISPEFAVFSAGPACERGGYNAWQFGHPRNSVIDRLEAGMSNVRSTPVEVLTFDRPERPTNRKIYKAIYSTGWDGTIVLEANANGDWKVETSTPHSCLQQ